MDDSENKPVLSYREYYLRVWHKARELEGSGWAWFAWGQIMFAVVGVVVLGLAVGSSAGYTVASIIDEERTGIILLGIGLIFLGIVRMAICLLRAPAVIDIERQMAANTLKTENQTSLLCLAEESSRLAQELSEERSHKLTVDCECSSVPRSDRLVVTVRSTSTGVNGVSLLVTGADPPIEDCRLPLPVRPCDAPSQDSIRNYILDASVNTR